MELARRLPLEAHQHLEQCARCREEAHQLLAVDNLLLSGYPDPPPDLVAGTMARVRAREAVAETEFAVRDDDFAWDEERHPGVVEPRRLAAMWAACMVASWGLCYLLWSGPWRAVGEWWSNYASGYGDGWSLAVENSLSASLAQTWDFLQQA